MESSIVVTNAIQPTVTTDLYREWLAFLADRTPKTQSTYERNIRQFAAYTRERGITRPTRADIIAYRNHLEEAYKPTTAQAYMAAVKLFFKWLAQEDLYKNVAQNIRGFKLDTDHKKDYLTTGQVKAVLSHIDKTTAQGKRDYAIAALMLTTGLRTTSIINANIEDLGTAGDSIALYYKGKGHTEKAEYVKVAPAVEAAIREYLATRQPLQAEQPLFTSQANRNQGGRLTTKSISRICKTMLVAAGLNSDRLTAHSFRHTAATQNLLNGGSLEETQQLLGHRNINTTMIYLHNINRAKNNSELRIADALLG